MERSPGGNQSPKRCQSDGESGTVTGGQERSGGGCETWPQQAQSGTAEHGRSESASPSATLVMKGSAVRFRASAPYKPSRTHVSPVCPIPARDASTPGAFRPLQACFAAPNPSVSNRIGKSDAAPQPCAQPCAAIARPAARPSEGASPAALTREGGLRLPLELSLCRRCLTC
jgi:hypothetical protein